MGVFYRNTGIRRGYVYGIRCGDFIKIGHAQDIHERMETMRLYNPHPIDLVFKIRTGSARHFERKMHEILAPHAVGREWFKVTVDQIKIASSAASIYAREIIQQAKQADRVRADRVAEARAARFA